MQIEIIKVNSLNTSNDSTKIFGLYLKKFQSYLHMLHWYSPNHNVHEILGEVYESIDGSFDKLQEEIIGTTRLNGAVFPMINNHLDVDELSQYGRDVCQIIEFYNKASSELKTILCSIDFNQFVTTVQSGINNTKEDIITTLNKGSYLLSMVN